jgi:hypothetical protein
MEQLNAAIDEMIESGSTIAEVIGFLEIKKYNLLQQVFIADDDECEEDDEN